MKPLYFRKTFFLICKYLTSIVLSRNNKLIESSKPKTILVVALDYIGDAVLTSPAFEILRNNFPNAHITVMCGSWAKAVYQKIPNIDELIIYDSNQFNRSPLKTPFLKKVSIIIEYYFKREWGFILVLRGSMVNDLAITLRNPFYYLDIDAFYGEFLVKRILSKYFKFSFARVQEPALSRPGRIMQLLSRLRINSYQCPRPLLLLPESHDQKVTNIKQDLGLSLSKEIVTIHPCAHDVVKRWSVEHWANVCDYINSNYGLEILLCGGSSDYNYVEEIRLNTKSPVINLAGKTDMNALFSLIKLSKFCIGLDSGPMHIAAAYDVPGIVLFGFDDPHTCCPWSNLCSVIYHAEGDMTQRMSLITTEEVIHQINVIQNESRDTFENIYIKNYVPSNVLE